MKDYALTLLELRSIVSIEVVVSLTKDASMHRLRARREKMRCANGLRYWAQKAKRLPFSAAHDEEAG
jgi:hypothetical protein